MTVTRNPTLYKVTVKGYGYLMKQSSDGQAVAFTSGSGGTGKTTAALAVAITWAEQGMPVTLVDVDSKDAGSAVDWLDRAQPEPPQSLTWTKSTPIQLAAALEHIEGQIIIDTPPRLDHKPLISVVNSVTAVVVTGMVDEAREIIQSARTLQAETSTPVAVLFTRTEPATAASMLATAVQEAINAMELPILGTIRSYAAIRHAKGSRGLPGRVNHTQAEQDTKNAVEALSNWLQRS